ncbi:MAG: two-component regulator propeller domain-containing protein [Candidatus Latescibacterota bacterium]
MRRANLILGMWFVAMIGSTPSYSRDNSDWTTYTSMNWPNDLLPDSDGVWAATLGGVYRYSTKDSTYTTLTNLNGLAGNTVLAIERDASGNVWFGTDGDGLSKWVEGKGIVATYPEFADDRINALSAHDGKLFVATANNGISLFLPDREEVKENYRMLGTLSRGVEVSCVEVMGDRLWVGTPEGIAFADLSQPNLLDPASWNSRRMVNVRAIAHDDSVVYVGTQWGVSEWKNGNWKIVGLAMGQVYDLSVHGTDILAATEKGLYRRTGGIWARDVRFSNEIPVYLAQSASPGPVWIYARGMGLNALRGPLRTHISPPPGPPGNKFMDLQVDPHGVLWAATSARDEEAHGVYRFDGEWWVQYFTKSVVAVQVDQKGRIWGGTWGRGGFVIEDDGTAATAPDSIFELSPENTPLQPTVGGGWVVVNDFSVDVWGNIWMCNYHGDESHLQLPVTPLVVVDDFPPSRQQAFTPSDDGLPTGEGTVVTADRSGLIWFGTRQLGFSLLDVGGTPFDTADDHLITFSTASHSKLTSDAISDIAVDRKGTIWVGTDNGVNAIRGTYSAREDTFLVANWETYGRGEGLGSAIIHVILEDGAGNMWFGTEEGLSRLSANDGSITTYTRANSGLVDNGVRSLAFDNRSGALWIGTTRGLSKLILPNSSTPPTLPAIRVFPNPMILSHTDAQITFADLPDDAASVRIFTLSGEPVIVLPLEAGTRTAMWDGGNASRSMVGSGVYFYVVTDSIGRHLTGKFAVIR